MADLYNSKTRQQEEINDPEMLQEAIKGRTHGFKLGEKIPAIDPYGKKVWVPSEEVHELADMGYRFPTKNEQEVERFVEAHSGPLSSIGVGVAQGINQLALGLPELIYNKTASPLEVAKKEALKKERQYANALGGTAGFIGSLFTGPGARLFQGASKAGTAVSKHVAEKLGAATAEQVGKRTLGQAAKSIAARTAGMGVEGGVISTPHAITEAALGDPQAAAEHLLSGLGIGSIFGVATGLGGEAFKVTRNVYRDIVKAAEERDVTIEKLARQMNQVWSGVPEERFKYYLQNRERVNNARTRAEIFDEINQLTSTARNQVDELKLAVKEKDQELTQAYQNARRDLAQSKTPQSVADEIALSLEGLKARAGSLSQEADEVLANTPGGVPLDEMISFIRNARKKYVPVMVGQKAKSTAQRLDALADDIQGLRQPGDPPLAYPAVRDILQQVRDDVDWSPLAAEFNTRLNAANKEFTHNLSELVKKDSPQYAEIMVELKKLADLHESMVKKGFADRAKGATLFDRIVKKGSQVDEKLISEYDSIAGAQFSRELNSLRTAKMMLEKSTRRDLRRVLTPQLYEQRELLKQQLDKAEKFYEPMSALTTERILPAMQNLDRKRPNLLTERAFQYLDDVSGKNFIQEIDDRNTLDMFLKEDKAGTRKTFLSTVVASGLGSLLGLGTGGPVGAIAGAVGGATLDIYSGQILKALVDRTPSVSGLLFVEKALKQNGQKIDEIPGLLQRWAEKKPKKYKTDTAAIGALWRVLEADKTDAHKHEHKQKGLSESTMKLSEINEKLTLLLSNPEAMQEHLSRITEGLIMGGAPEIASAFVIEAQKLLQYIYASMPKPPQPSSPFGRQIKWRPPDYQLFAFAQKLQVLENPFMVLDALEDGTLTKNHVEALQVVFPKLYEEMRGKFMQIAMSGAAQPLDYNQRIKLSLLLDMPLDSSLTSKNINYLQSTFADGQEPDQETPTSGAFHPQMNTKYPRGLETQSQQLLEVR